MLQLIELYEETRLQGYIEIALMTELDTDGRPYERVDERTSR